MARTLDVDVSERLVELERMYLLDEADYEVARQAAGAGAGLSGFARDGYVVVKRTGSYPEDMQHEVLHGLVRITWHLREDSDGTLQVQKVDEGLEQSPVDQPGGVSLFRLAKEVMIEMMSIEAAHQEWQEIPELSTLDTSELNHGYQAGLVVVDAMFKKVAETTGRTYIETFRDFQDHSVIGNDSAMNGLTDTFGWGGRLDIAGWDNPGSEITSMVADWLGLPDAAEKCRALGRGEKVVVMEDLIPGGVKVRYKDLVPEIEVGHERVTSEDHAAERGEATGDGVTSEPRDVITSSESVVGQAMPAHLDVVDSPDAVDPPRASASVRQPQRRRPLSLSSHNDNSRPGTSGKRLETPSLLASSAEPDSVEIPLPTTAEEPLMPEISQTVESQTEHGLDTL